MAVSANTLFHFTKDSNLKSILSSQGFFAQYSEEHFEDILPEESIYRITLIPLISFCDLTIMQLSGDSLHREHYGEYGIGLTKQWGINKKVSPIIYVHENSQPSNQLYDLIKLFRKYSKENDNSDAIQNVRQELVDSFKFIKPYQGRWHKEEKIPTDKDDIVYYDEREWRYSPLIKDFRVLSGVRKENKAKKKKYNTQLKSQLLKFEHGDIKYILIKKKSEIQDFVDVINKMKLDDDRRVDRKKKNELVTKIITFEEIKEDF